MAAAEKDPSAGMLKELHSKAEYLSSAAAKDRRQLSKARLIDSEEVVRLRDEWKRKIIIRQSEQLPGRRKSKVLQKTSAENQVKGKGN